MQTESKIGVIVQARMSSNRFPGKVLHQVYGRPLIDWLLESLSNCKAVDAIGVATSTDSTDDGLAAHCLSKQIACHRGPLEDVALRFVEAARAFGFKAFVRISGDSPLLDYRLVDKAVTLFRKVQPSPDLVTNLIPRTFPKGQSVEVVSVETFEKAYTNMSADEEFEHVTKFFYNNPSAFRIEKFTSGKQLETIQMSVDTPADMTRFIEMTARMDRPHWTYEYTDLVEMLAANRR